MAGGAAVSLQARFRLRRGDFELEAVLDAPAAGVTGITGPSGCGKTTLLRAVAGLETAEEARVVFQGEVWQDGPHGLPVHRRGVGYVFQDAALFPHLDVRGNLDYGRRRGGRRRTALGRDEAVDLLGLGRLLERSTDRLSGGERQRVALARALLAGPRLLLLDEPLASLDAAARGAILPLLARVFAAADLPVLYVSHALDEVARLADRVAVMEAGRIVAAGPAAEVLTRLDLPPARAEGAESLLVGAVRDHDDDDHLTALDVPGGTLWVPRADLAAGTPVRVRIPARDVSLVLAPPDGTSILNILPARVDAVADDGPGRTLVRLDCAGSPLLARVTTRSARRLNLKPGLELFAQVKSVALLS